VTQKGTWDGRGGVVKRLQSKETTELLGGGIIGLPPCSKGTEGGSPEAAGKGESFLDPGESEETRRTWEFCSSETEWLTDGELKSTLFPTNGWSGTG